MKKIEDLFTVDRADFDKWLAAAEARELHAAAEIILKKLSHGEILSSEDKRRIDAFMDKSRKICMPLKIWDQAMRALPALLLDGFQGYLIGGKLLGFGPFRSMPWLVILLPFIISEACSAIFAVYDAIRGK